MIFLLRCSCYFDIGNKDNNVYCQDNEISWIDWDDARTHDVLTEFTAALARLRATHPVFCRRRFFHGRPIRGSDIEDIAWLRPDGQQMSDEDWNAGFTHALTVFLNGHGIPDRNALGEPITDDSFLLLINAHHEAITFTLPGQGYGENWEIVLDTADPHAVHVPEPGAVSATERHDIRCRPGRGCLSDKHGSR